MASEADQEPQLAAQVSELTAELERITPSSVLADRCPSPMVIKVLEVVHPLHPPADVIEKNPTPASILLPWR